MMKRHLDRFKRGGWNRHKQKSELAIALVFAALILLFLAMVLAPSSLLAITAFLLVLAVFAFCL